jgi:very-short-patch-repair endonuclease
MRFHFNSTLLKYRRKDLRKKSTKAELIMWEELRRNKLGVKFFRQYSVDGYVLDFYCPKKRLGIELEGEIHKKTDVRKYDEYRRKYLEAFGINIITIENDNINYELEKVIIFIRNKLI